MCKESKSEAWLFLVTIEQNFLYNYQKIWWKTQTFTKLKSVNYFVDILLVCGKISSFSHLFWFYFIFILRELSDSCWSMYCFMDCSWQGLLVLKIHTFQARLDTFIFVSGKKKVESKNLKCNQKAKSWHLAEEIAASFPVEVSFF